MMNLEGPRAYCMFLSIGLLSLEMISADARSIVMSANAHNEGVHESHDTIEFH